MYDDILSAILTAWLIIRTVEFVLGWFARVILSELNDRE